MAKKGGGLNKKVIVSEDLAKIVGPAKTTRPQITKKVWDYIKKHQLQDCDDRRVIHADECLYPIFKKKKIGMMQLAGALNAHIFADE